MRKHFLLVFLLALLPMVGWAQWGGDVSASPVGVWKSGLTTQEFSYLTTPDFPNAVNVRSEATYSDYWGGHIGNFNCASLGIGTDYPTADAAQYYYNVYASETATTPIPVSDLTAGGSYVLRLFVKYVSEAYCSGWSLYNWTANTYATKEYNLPFTIASKPEVTVKVYSLTRTWDNGIVEPTIDDFNSTAELRSVSGATTNWNDVKDYLEFKRVDNGTDVGTYAYTLALKSTHPSYTIHIDDASAKLNITQATNVAGTVSLADWTYGETAKTPTISGFKYFDEETVEYTYSTASTGPWDTYENVVKDQAGDYYVKATVPEIINYTEAEATASFKINKRDIDPATDFTVTAEDAANLVYTSHPLSLLKSFAWTDNVVRASAVSFSVNETNWYTLDEFKYTEVGDYPVYVKMTGDANHNDLASTKIIDKVSITEADIAEADVTAPVGETGLEYILDTTQELIATAAACAKGTPMYSVDGGAWTDDLTKIVGEHVKAGDAKYVVSWYIKGDANHNDYGSEATPAGTVEVAIAPVDFVLKEDAEVATGLIFNAGAQKLLSKSVKGGAANMPTGSTTWTLDGTALAAGSTYEDVKGTDAGKYTISYTVVPKDAKYENDYNPYTKELEAEIGQYTLFIGGKTIEGVTIEDVVDLEAGTPKVSMADFINDGALIGSEDATTKAAILNALVIPAQTLEKIIANAKVGSNEIALTAGSVEAAKKPETNYAVDAAHLLSNSAWLKLIAKEAAIQAAPAGYTDLAYTGDDQELVETAAVGYKAMGGAGTVAIGKVVYSLTEDGDYTDDLTKIVGKDAGEYEVFYKVELDASEAPENLDKFYEYTDGVKSIKVTIAQAANAITNLALEGWTYGEEANTPVADALFKAEGEPTFTYSDSETGTFVETVPTDAGTWYVKASVAETTNWAAAEKTISFEIGKAEATITTAPVAKTLIYNREAQELVEAGVSNDGTVMYSLTGDAADFAEAIPTGTDAGEYNVYYMVKGDANHTDLVVAEPVVVTIAPADVTDIVAPAAINLTYNGYDQALAEPATFEDEFVKGTFEYSIDGENWSADIPVAKNAGEYTVQTKFTPNANHNEATVADVKVTINKATIGYNLSNLEKVWDGELFGEEEISKLFTLYAGGEGGKLFGDDEYDKPFTLTLPEDYRDAGTYTFKQPKVEFKTKEGGYEKDYPVNYNVTFAGEAQVIIDMADLVEVDDYTAPAAIGGLVYDFGNKMDLVTPGSVTSKNAEDYPNTEIAGKEYGTIVFSTEKDGEYTEDIPQGDLAGEYSVWFKVAGDINHNDTEPVEITNTIGTYELTADFLPEEYKTELPYKAAPYEASDFIPALEGITEDEGYTVGTSEMKDAGEYVILYTGINNLSGSFEVKVNITPIDVIAVAPKGIKKVYDGTASLEGVVKNGDISFVGVLSGDKITLPEDLALSTEGIAVGTYPIKVDAAAINDLNKNYNILDESIDGELTINKAPAFTIGFDEVPATWTKEFGEADPELTGYTVKVTDGKCFDLDDVLAATTAEREPGEDVGSYDVTLNIDATAEVFANYEGVEFDGTAAEFTITKSEKVYTVSVANITETYKAEEFETALTIAPEDLVIAGYEGDLDKFFTTLPTATIPAGAKDAGDYNITLSDGESTNFNFTFVPATFTIAPFEVTKATIEAQKVQKGKELDVTKFTITAPEADAELFYVTAPGLVDMDDVVTGEAGVYADGLVIAVDESVADNYVGLDKFTAELEIIAADAIVLADDEDFVTEDKDGVDVTFASRTLNAGTWNVVALPFEATIAQISNAFGYAAVDILDESNKKTDEIHFMITTSGSIPAYTPFIVKTTDDEGLKKTNFDQVVFHNVNLEASEGENKAISDGAGNQFIGTFKGETTFWGKKYRYMSKGAWYNAAAYSESNPVKIKAFRGYIEMVNASARIFIEEPDGTVTAIDAVNFNKAEAEGMYNLNGVKVNNANRKGVFIQNGKKVINK